MKLSVHCKRTQESVRTSPWSWCWFGVIDIALRLFDVSSLHPAVRRLEFRYQWVHRCTVHVLCKVDARQTLNLIIFIIQHTVQIDRYIHLKAGSQPRADDDMGPPVSQAGGTLQPHL